MDRRLSVSLPNGHPPLGAVGNSALPTQAHGGVGGGGQSGMQQGPVDLSRLRRVPSINAHYPNVANSVVNNLANVNTTSNSHNPHHRASIFLPIPESPSDPNRPEMAFPSPQLQPRNNNNNNNPNHNLSNHNHHNHSHLPSSPSSPLPPPLPPHLEGIYINRPKRSNSILSFGQSNRRRILSLLEEVRKKRELRDRRKSDMNVTYYLDDIMFTEEDPLGTTSNSYRKRKKLYQFLNHPSGAPWAITYHIAVFLIVFLCLMLTICATIPKLALQQRAISAVYMLEKIVIIWFTIEFMARLWCCSCKKQYRGLAGKAKYLAAPARLIDLLVLILTTIVLVVNPSKTGHEIFVVSAFRGFHRFFQIAQVLTLNRPLKPWKVLGSVIYDQREQLFIILYTEFIVLCALSYVAFLVERDQNENFNSIADAMWWAIVTLSTVGYGDRVPVTWGGKIISTCFTILGVAIFALPAGIIGTGLALKIEEEERNQIRNRKKVSAAILIQRAYRCYKANINHEMVARFFRERPMAIYKQHDYRNMAQKFIALAQFTIAKNRFRELMRPVDMKNIIQNYRDGQTEVMLRSKLLQQSIEELSRRVEQGENRVASLSMRLESRQSTFDGRMEAMNKMLEGVHRLVLANQALIELSLPQKQQQFQAQQQQQQQQQQQFQRFENFEEAASASGVQQNQAHLRRRRRRSSM